MADDDTDDAPAEGGEEADSEGEEKSFRERVEEIRERRAEEREEGERPDPEEMMGGEGGNPFAQMMSGMMGGGGPGGMGGGPPGMGGGPPGMGGGPGGRDEEESVGNEELVREVRQLRDEVRDATRQLQRIAQAIEDD
jgi:hypothetical protein